MPFLQHFLGETPQANTHKVIRELKLKTEAMRAKFVSAWRVSEAQRLCSNIPFLQQFLGQSPKPTHTRSYVS